mgnify:CR=1 FL=1
MRNRLKKAKLSRIYDLQTSYRSSLYYKSFWPAQAPEWSGISPGCSHFHSNPERDKLHTVDRLEDQLLEAGVMLPSPPDFSWVNKDMSKFKISQIHDIEFMVQIMSLFPHNWPLQWFFRDFFGDSAD